MQNTTELFLNFYKYKRKVFNIVRNFSRTCETFSKSEHLNVVFFGTDNFSLPSLKTLYNESKHENSKISSIKVVTSFKSPSNPVRNFAIDKNLQLFKWPVNSETLQGNNLGIVVSFGHLIPNKIISAFSLGMINVHASLLPRWRGAAPIIYTIMNDDKITGVTVMKIEPYHFDIGPILAQKEIPVKPNILLPELHIQLANEGSKLLLDILKNSPESLQNGKPQDESLVTYAPKITPCIAHIKWDEMNSQEICNRYRALYAFQQLYTFWQDSVVKIVDIDLDSSCSNSNINLEPGSLECKPGYVEFSKIDKTLKITCKDCSRLIVKRIKVEGKKIITAIDFNNGYLRKLTRGQRFFK